MARIRDLRTFAFVGLLIVCGMAVTIAMSERSEAQPKFRNFDPPKNPVASSIDHTFDFPEEVRGAARQNQSNAGTSYTGYVKLYDEHETVSVMIPAEWNDVELGHQTEGNHGSSVMIMASPDLESYQNGAAPGVTVVATSHEPADGNDIAVLDRETGQISRRCGAGRVNRFEYSDPFYSGHYDFYAACERGASQLVMAAMPASNDLTVRIDAAILNEADLEAVTNVMESFDVIGEPGHDDHHDHEH